MTQTDIQEEKTSSLLSVVSTNDAWNSVSQRVTQRKHSSLWNKTEMHEDGRWEKWEEPGFLINLPWNYPTLELLVIKQNKVFFIV